MNKNPNYIQVEGEPDLVRDKNSQAILNVNSEKLQAFKKRREQERKVRNVVEEFDSLKLEMKEIKELLKILLDK